MNQRIEELEVQKEQLTLENKKCFEILIRHSKNKREGQESLFAPSEPSIKYQTETSITQEKRQQKAANELSVVVRPQSFRPLSLKQLRELI